MAGERKRSRFCFFAAFLLLALLPSAYAACGDAICDDSENKCSCPGDCGNCYQSASEPVCKEYYCATPTGPCLPRPLLNCCGNLICEKGEDFNKCRSDCSPKAVTIELLGFLDREYLRGEPVSLAVLVKADGEKARGAEVSASGFFGDMQMHDDANHRDEKNNDAIYGGEFAVGSSTAEGSYPVTITAEVSGTPGSKTFPVRVSPRLDLEFSTDQAQYFLGDTIRIEGTLARRDVPLEQELSVEFLAGGKGIFTSTARSDANGNFSAERHTSLIDPAGEWLVIVSAADKNMNSAAAEKKIDVRGAEGTAYYKVEVLEPMRKAFSRGETISFLVLVKDTNGVAVGGAEAEAAIAEQKMLALKESSPGTYAGSFALPYDFPLGEQKLHINVSKAVNETLLAGFSSTSIYISALPLSIEIISPAKSTFNAAEAVDFELKLLYAFDKPVEHASIDLNIFGTAGRAAEEGRGIYTYSGTMPADREGESTILITARDKFGNYAAKEFNIKVISEFNLVYLLFSQPVLLSIFIALALFALAAGVLVVAKKVRLRLLAKRRAVLIEMKRKLQEEYFNERIINSTEYYSLLDKYNEGLEKIDTAVGSIMSDK